LLARIIVRHDQAGTFRIAMANLASKLNVSATVLA
jgi:hypothetical protein